MQERLHALEPSHPASASRCEDHIRLPCRTLGSLQTPPSAECRFKRGNVQVEMDGLAGPGHWRTRDGDEVDLVLRA